MERNFVWQYTEFCKFIVSPAANRCILVTGKFVKLCLKLYIFEDGHLFTIKSIMSKVPYFKIFKKRCGTIIAFVLRYKLKILRLVNVFEFSIVTGNTKVESVFYGHHDLVFRFWNYNKCIFCFCTGVPLFL